MKSLKYPKSDFFDVVISTQDFLLADALLRNLGIFGGLVVIGVWWQEFTMRSASNPLHWPLKAGGKQLMAMLIGSGGKQSQQLWPPSRAKDTLCLFWALRDISHPVLLSSWSSCAKGTWAEYLWKVAGFGIRTAFKVLSKQIIASWKQPLLQRNVTGQDCQ